MAQRQVTTTELGELDIEDQARRLLNAPRLHQIQRRNAPKKRPKGPDVVADERVMQPPAGLTAEQLQQRIWRPPAATASTAPVPAPETAANPADPATESQRHWVIMERLRAQQAARHAGRVQELEEKIERLRERAKRKEETWKEDKDKIKEQETLISVRDFQMAALKTLRDKGEIERQTMTKQAEKAKKKAEKLAANTAEKHEASKKEFRTMKKSWKTEVKLRNAAQSEGKRYKVKCKHLKSQLAAAKEQGASEKARWKGRLAKKSQAIEDGKRKFTKHRSQWRRKFAIQSRKFDKLKMLSANQRRRKK